MQPSFFYLSVIAEKLDICATKRGKYKHCGIDFQYQKIANRYTQLGIVTNFVMSAPTLPLVKSFIALGLFFTFPIWHEKFPTYLFQPKVLKNLTGFADIWGFIPTFYQVKFKNCKSIKNQQQHDSWKAISDSESEN